jgi:hypothetical protein
MAQITSHHWEKVNHCFSESELETYNRILDGVVINVYIKDSRLYNVIQISQYVYIHYSMSSNSKVVIIQWHYSHSINHITIP